MLNLIFLVIYSQTYLFSYMLIPVFFLYIHNRNTYPISQRHLYLNILILFSWSLYANSIIYEIVYDHIRIKETLDPLLINLIIYLYNVRLILIIFKFVNIKNNITEIDENEFFKKNKKRSLIIINIYTFITGGHLIFIILNYFLNIDKYSIEKWALKGIIILEIVFLFLIWLMFIKQQKMSESLKIKYEYYFLVGALILDFTSYLFIYIFKPKDLIARRIIHLQLSFIGIITVGYLPIFLVYKIRYNMIKRELYNEISLHEIINNKDLFLKFLEFTNKEFSSENLLFYFSAQEYLNDELAYKENKKDLFNKIYLSYIKDSSPYEINISHDTKLEFDDLFRNKNNDMDAKRLLIHKTSNEIKTVLENGPVRRFNHN